jgi:hypothetical protein
MFWTPKYVHDRITHRKVDIVSPQVLHLKHEETPRKLMTLYTKKGIDSILVIALVLVRDEALYVSVFQHGEPHRRSTHKMESPNFCTRSRSRPG